MTGDIKHMQVAKGKSRWQRLPSLPFAIATCLCLLLLTSCLSYKEVELVDIANVEVEKMDAKGVYVRVDALITNPNGYRIHVLDPDVDIFLNGTLVGKGVLDSALVLDGKRSRLYSVPMHADLQGGSLVMVMLSGALNGGKFLLGAKGTVVGKAGLIRKRFPFELEEELEF